MFACVLLLDLQLASPGWRECLECGEPPAQHSERQAQRPDTLPVSDTPWRPQDTNHPGAAALGR